MNCKCEIIKNNICRYLSKIFSELKYYLIIFAIFFTLAFVTGILTAAKYSSDITYDNFLNQTILEFLKKEKGIFSLFLSYYFWFFLLSIFVILFTKNIFFSILETLIFMLFSYIVGFDLSVFIYSFGLVGIIFGIFIYGLLMILVAITFIIIISIATKKMKCKNVYCSCEERKELRKIYFVFLILGLMFLYLICILLSILHIFVIIE